MTDPITTPEHTCAQCVFFARGYRLQGMKVPDFCTRHHHSQRYDDPACSDFKAKPQ